MLQRKKVYNIKVTGGRPFSVSCPGNPVFEHNGIRSLGNILMSECEKSEFLKISVNHGAAVEMGESMTSEETSEEIRRRKALESMDDIVFPTDRCHSCSFCDLKEEEVICGLTHWTEEFRDTVAGTDSGQKDIELCPKR